MSTYTSTGNMGEIRFGNLERKVEGIEGGKKDNGVSSNIEIIECSYIHQTQ